MFLGRDLVLLSVHWTRWRRRLLSHRRYNDEFRAEVLAEYRRSGLSAAEHATGVSRVTILRWAASADIGPDDRARITTEVSERNRRAAAAQFAKVARDRAEARERVVNRLVKVSEASLIRELEVLAAGGFSAEDLQALTNARMKAIQQFELLDGRATDGRDLLIDDQRLLHAVSIALAACWRRRQRG